MLARVATQLQARDWLRDHNEALESEVARRMVGNDLTQRVAIPALAHLAETRDPETGNHILRMQAYVRLFALGLREHARFALTDSDRYVELLTHSAPLHDISVANEIAHWHDEKWGGSGQPDALAGEAIPL